MTFVCRTYICLAMGVGVGLAILPSSLGQAAVGAPAAALSNSVAVTPPAPPATKSPVDTFRELLAMNAAERRDFLTNRSPESRKLILAKVREYDTLSPDQRDLRLRATELRWYLLPLMQASRTNRAEQLAAIPVEVRKLVEDRIQLWDMLPPELQKELLDNEAIIQFRTEPGDAKRSI